MSDLDWQKHDADIVRFVRETTDFYLRTEASTGEPLREDQGILLRNNYATPRMMGPLLNYLNHVTDQVDDKLQSIRTACLVAGMNLDECVAGSSTFGPIFSDLEKWKSRMKVYEEQTAAAMDRDPDASGDTDPVFWDHVTKPLLLGIWAGTKRQRRLDAVTPLILAWQIEVAKDAYREARAEFWKDLKDQAALVYDTIADFGGSIILLAVGAVALGYGLSR